MDYGDTDIDDNNYEDDTSGNDNNDVDDNEPLGEAHASPEDKNLRWVCLLTAVVRTNQDYGLGMMVPLPNASASALATFMDMVLQVLTFFVLHLLMQARGFSEEDPAFCFCCLR
jgi:hypothetical protein